MLFTVHGSDKQVFAVGGVLAGEIYGLTPGNVVRQHLPAVKSINGLYVRPDGWTVAGGEGGQFLLGTDDSQWGSGVLFLTNLRPGQFMRFIRIRHQSLSVAICVQ